MIRVDNISFAYEAAERPAPSTLSNVSVDIQAGESIAIMGHNGSGKTTFARCLNGLLVPTAGKIVVDGLNAADEKNIPDIRRLVGMVFQNPDNQIVSTTVEREIAFGLENLGVPYDEMHAIVDQALNTFNLRRYRQHSPHYLSGGEKQRLALAAVMAMRPQYLVLDEPTSLLDPQGRREILSIVRELHTDEKSKICTLLITQFPEEALHVDRLIVFARGKIVMDADPLTVFDNVDELSKIGLEPPLTIRVNKLLDSIQSS